MAHGWEEQAADGPISRRLRIINAPQVVCCAGCGVVLELGVGFVVAMQRHDSPNSWSARVCEACGLDLLKQLFTGR